MYGAQVGPMYNYATRMHGVQVGLINYSRRASGIQFGLLNFMQDGPLPFFPLINLDFSARPAEQ
jgi:hypothetical protein